MISGSLSKREGITYAGSVVSTLTSIPRPNKDKNETEVMANLTHNQNNQFNDEIMVKLNLAIQNSQTCAQVAAENLNTAQKVDENMKLIARKECEIFYNKTIREVDEKVMNLRNEFSHWFINGQPILHQQQSNTNNHLMTNNGLSYPYIQNTQSSFNLNNQLISCNQNSYQASAQKSQNTSYQSVSQDNSYTAYSNA